jgi:transcription elongation factor Elf1
MMSLVEKNITCPYCGELSSVLIDGSIEQQSYIEDCSVCCQPINLNVNILSDDQAAVEAHRDNE